jgi:hypothetical protein
MTVDPSGQEVLSFALALRNASQIGTYAKLIIGMFESPTWRKYETALGPEAWHAHEFDYFLIAMDARYEDLVRILTWKSIKDVNLAEAMMGDASEDRRALDVASADWRSPDGRSLIETARANGWLNARADLKAPTLKAPPISDRARIGLRHGMTFEEHARRARSAALPADIRTHLGKLIDQFIEQVRVSTDDPVNTLRYVMEQLAIKSRKGMKKRAFKRRLTEKAPRLHQKRQLTDRMGR